MAGDVAQVGRAHPHPVPHLAFGERLLHAHARRVFREVDRRRLVEVVVIAHFLQVGHDELRAVVGPIGEHEHMVALGLETLARTRLDDDRTVQAGLLLETGVAVVPVGAALLEREAVGEGFAGLDAGVVEARHAVHLERQQDAVPMDRARHGQMVGNTQGHGVALAPSQQGSRDGAVDGGRHARAAGDVDGCLADREIELRAGQNVLAGGHGCRTRQRRPKTEAGEGAADSCACDESPPGKCSATVVRRKGMVKHHVAPVGLSAAGVQSRRGRMHGAAFRAASIRRLVGGCVDPVWVKRTSTEAARSGSHANARSGQ